MADATRKVDVLEKLLTVFSVEQLDLLADASLRVQERAIQRRCHQEVTVVFNERGYPRDCKASDTVVFQKPSDGGEGLLPCGHPKSSLVRRQFGQLPYCEKCGDK